MRNSRTSHNKHHPSTNNVSHHTQFMKWCTFQVMHHVRGLLFSNIDDMLQIKSQCTVLDFCKNTWRKLWTLKTYWLIVFITLVVFMLFNICLYHWKETGRMIVLKFNLLYRLVLKSFFNLTLPCHPTLSVCVCAHVRVYMLNE